MGLPLPSPPLSPPSLLSSSKSTTTQRHVRVAAAWHGMAWRGVAWRGVAWQVLRCAGAVLHARRSARRQLAPAPLVLRTPRHEQTQLPDYVVLAVRSLQHTAAPRDQCPRVAVAASPTFCLRWACLDSSVMCSREITAPHTILLSCCAVTSSRTIIV